MNRSFVLWAFVCFAAWFLFTSSGYLAAGDEETMFEVAQNLVEQADPAIDNALVAIPIAPYPGFLPSQVYTVETTQVSTGWDGRHYSPYGIGQSLVAAPLYLAGKILIALWPGPGWVLARMLPQFLVAIWLAGCAALIIRFGLDLGFGPRVSGALAIAFGLGTMAWPYVKCWYAEPATAFWLLLSAFCVFRLGVERRHRWALLAGVAFGAALTFRTSAMIATLPLGVYAAFALRGQRGHRRRYLTNVGLALAGMAPGLAIVALYNLARFGQILTISYSETRIGWDTPFVYGLYGLLFSPGKSIFIYSPVLVLSLVGVLVWLSVRPREAWLAGSMFVVFVAFHSPYTFWTGGWNWGPRFLLPAVPFLVLAVGPVLQYTGTRWLRPAFAILVAVGILVQAPAVLVDHSREIIALSQTGLSFYDRTIRQIEMSPAIRQWPTAMNVLTLFTQPAAWAAARQSLNGAVIDAPETRGSALISVRRTEFLRANTPAFWWVHLILSGASPAMAVGLGLLNLAVAATAGVMAVRSLRDQDGSNARQSDNMEASGSCYVPSL